MSQQKLELQLKGLFTSPNTFSGVPDGSLAVANNVVISNKNLITSRRGQTQYGSPLELNEGQVEKMFNYSQNLIISYDGKMAYDNAGTWVDFAGTYTPPDINYKMRSLEAQKNFYFTTNAGIFKIDSLTGTPVAAGVVKALGGIGTTTANAGFLPSNTTVAYRFVWGYRDANKNLVLGAPSQRVIVSNLQSNSREVTLDILIPDTITTDYFLQVYRSDFTANLDSEPSDQLQLVIEVYPTSGEISAKKITVLDNTPNALKGADLYTNASQEGIANANNQPPVALDMDVYKTCAFYANTRQKQSIEVSLIGVNSAQLLATINKIEEELGLELSLEL